MVTVSRVVTHLEMTAPDQLRSSTVPGLSLEPWPDGVERLRAMHDAIATPHRWPSLAWSQDEWARQLDDNTWLAVRASGELVGLAALERQEAQVEITVFGLLPAFQGQRLGSAALTLAVHEAWKVPGTQRVWLHTSTRDGERALANYLGRGFTAFATEVRTEELPG